MTQELQPVDRASLPALDAAIVAYVEASKASNTRKAYASDWAHFEEWCNTRGGTALPALSQTVAAYITALADTHKPATLQRRLASISVAHQAAGYPSPAGAPLVRTTMQGIRRKHGVSQRQASPLLVEHIRQAVCLSGDTALAIRDRAIILLGLAGAFRRSELVALDVADLQFREQGVIVTLQRSKTNQEGADESKDIGYGAYDATCPVRALRRWLDLAGIESGPVFRRFTQDGRAASACRLSDRAVSRIVKAAVKRIGLSEDAFSGHSLRAGFVTQGYRVGIPEADIMKQSGHKSRAVVGKYRREGERFLTNYSAKVGL